MPKNKSQQDPHQNSMDNITNLADKTLEAINAHEEEFGLDENSEVTEFRDSIENFLANFKG